MRRFVASLSLLALANLVFVQADSVCPLAESAHANHQTVSAAAPDHEGHQMGTMSEHGAAQPAPDPGSSHPSGCLTMGPCGMTLDLANSVVAASMIAKADDVIGGSEPLPRSVGIAPDLPPPRA